MNLTYLHELCKKYRIECYQYALHSYSNAPLGIYPSIEGVISFEVEQSFGCKVNKKFTKDFTPTIEQ